MTGDRTMNTQRFRQFTAAMLLAAGLGACGGGSSDLAGIGGTGITATGQITGFGSIFVNGVEYFIKDGATIMVNGMPTQESELKLGMIVTISGTLNDDGVTGTVDSVVYESELEGPITAIDPNGPDPDGKLKTLVVLGRNVIVDAISTSFGDETGSGGNYGFDTLAINDVIEVSGYVVDSSGTLQATRIEKEDVHTPGSGTTVVEVKGTVTAFAPAPANSFTLDGVLTVDFDPATTDMQELTNGISIGNAVEVTGNFTDATTIFATRISSDDSGLPDEAEQAEIEGLVTDFVSNSNFKVNGQTIDATAAQIKPAGTTLADGLFVEAKGPIMSGTLEATEIEVRNSDIEIEAYVSGTPANSTVRLQITSSDFIDVVVDSNITQMEEDANSTPIAFSALSDGDFLKVEAYKDSNGAIIATQIKRLTTTETELVLKAPVDSWTLMGSDISITLLGITFTSDAGTEFEHNDQSLADAAAMDNQLNSLGGGMVFKVGDELAGSTFSDGIASEMEVES